MKTTMSRGATAPEAATAAPPAVGTVAEIRAAAAPAEGSARREILAVRKAAPQEVVMMEMPIMMRKTGMGPDQKTGIHTAAGIKNSLLRFQF
jgi:hypothetical protein